MIFGMRGRVFVADGVRDERKEVSDAEKPRERRRLQDKALGG